MRLAWNWNEIKGMASQPMAWRVTISTREAEGLVVAGSAQPQVWWPAVGRAIGASALWFGRCLRARPRKPGLAVFLVLAG